MSGLLQHLAAQGEWVVFAVVLLEQAGLPLPSMVLLLFGGAMAGMGHWSAGTVFLLAMAAALGPNLLWYWIGRRHGFRVLGLLCRISLDPNACVRISQDMVGRLGLFTLLIAKFVPGVSTLTPPLVGAMRIGMAQFLAFNVAGTVIWVGGVLAVGYLFRGQIEGVILWTERLGTTLGVAFLLLLLGWIAFKLLQRHMFARRRGVARISVDELREKLSSDASPLIVDLRHPMEERIDSHAIPGAWTVTPGQLKQRLAPVPREREIVLVCS